MADNVQRQPSNSRIVPQGFGQPFGHLLGNRNPDKGYKKYKTPSSDGSGETFYWRPKGKGDDLHPDSHRYTRSESYAPVYKNNPFPFGQRVQATVGNTNPFGHMMPNADTKLYTKQVKYTKAGRKEGISFDGRKGPERAKRAKYNKDDGSAPSRGGSSNTRTKRNKSTTLTSGRGLLGGGSTSSKTLGN